MISPYKLKVINLLISDYEVKCEKISQETRGMKVVSSKVYINFKGLTFLSQILFSTGKLIIIYITGKSTVCKYLTERKYTEY